MKIFRNISSPLLLGVMIACNTVTIKEEKEQPKTFQEEALDLIEELNKQNKIENQNTLRGNNFSEGAREIIEWHEDDYILESIYPDIVKIRSTEEFENLTRNPSSVRSIYIDNYDTDIHISDLSVFQNLEYLKVRSLDSLPKGFYKLTSLRVFEAANDLDCKMDERISELQNLEELRLDFVDLKLAPEISTLKKLTTLRLYNFNYNQPYASIYEIPNLKILRLKFSDSSQLEGISKLKSLRTFVTNKISSEVAELNLTGLYIGENSDESYPKELTKLNNLVAFYWQGNYVRRTPPEFVSSLKKLEYLEIRGCQKFDSIPESFNSLSKLKEFNIICRPKFNGDIEHLKSIKQVINIK